MAERFSDDDLREAARPHIGGDAAFIPIRSGKFNTSFFARAADGAEYVMRIAPPDSAGFIFYEQGMMAQEPGIHRLLLESTSVPVAEIIAHDTSREVLPRDFLIMRRLPGSPQSETALGPRETARLLGELGSALRQVHGLTDPAGRYGYLGEHGCMEPQGDWGSAFAVMWHKIIDDIEGCGGYAKQEAGIMRGFFDASRRIFDHAPPASLLHMDVWAQNILTDGEGRLTGLVDFDRALWGDPEIEFAVLDYCGVSQPAFWEGYGAERPDTREAGARGVFYYLYELQKYIVIERLRRRDASRADSYKQASLRMATEAMGR